MLTRTWPSRPRTQASRPRTGPRTEITGLALPTRVIALQIWSKCWLQGNILSLCGVLGELLCSVRVVQSVSTPRLYHNKKLISRWDTRTWHRSILLPLVSNVPDGEFTWDNIRKILHGDHWMANVHSGKEILLKASTPWAGNANVTDRWQMGLR